MDHTRQQIGSHGVVVLNAPEKSFVTATLPNDIISLAWEHEADIIAVDAEYLPAEVFRLRSGLLGEIAQKLANYRVRLVILGDISGHIAKSDALRDYVHETNLGHSLWFVPDIAALKARLSA